MSRGNASDILALEEEWLAPLGVPPSPYIQSLVDSLTTLV